MEKTDYYQAIFKRKSIRNYNLTPLNEDKLNEINEHLKTLGPLYNDRNRTEDFIIGRC